MKKLLKLSLVIMIFGTTMKIIGADASKQPSKEQTKFQAFDEELDLSTVQDLGKYENSYEISNGQSGPNILYSGNFPGSTCKLMCEKYLPTAKQQESTHCSIVKHVWTEPIIFDFDINTGKPMTTPLFHELPSSVFATIEATYKLQEARKAEKKAEGKK